MTDDGARPRVAVKGDGNITLAEVRNSTVNIGVGGNGRGLAALESATVRMGGPSPIGELRARSGLVAFSAREPLLLGLLDWAGQPTPFAVMVIGGSGGTGKTRLAVELCERASGWNAGFLSRSADSSAVGDLVNLESDRLVVIDYAETRGEQLEQLLPHLRGQAAGDRRVRVVLLVRRQGPAGSWLDSLRRRDYALGAALSAAEEIALDEAPLSVPEREGLFGAVVSSLAASSRPADTPPLDVLRDDVFRDPLLVVVSAYLHTRGHSRAETREALFEQLLEHEARYWQRRARDAGIDDDLVLLSRVVAVATSSEPGDETAASRLLSVVPDLEDASEKVRRRIARWAAEIYPSPDYFWGPLEPDLLGEHLVAQVAKESGGIFDNLLATLPDPSVVRVIEVLGRAAPNYSAVRDGLTEAFDRQLPELIEGAVAEASRVTPDALRAGRPMVAAALANSLEIAPPGEAALRRAANRMFGAKNPLLTPLALAIAELLADQHGRMPRGDENARVRLGISLNNVGTYLAELGRFEDALRFTRRALEVRRETAAEKADADPRVADSLANLSALLADLGRPDEALETAIEAVEVARAVNPDGREHDPAVLPVALSNLGRCYWEAGRREEALEPANEAVEVAERFSNEGPYFANVLAGTLTNLAIQLHHRHRSDEAITAAARAVDIRRQQTSGGLAGLPELRGALITYADVLQAAGQEEVATEIAHSAADCSRILYELDPSAFGPDFARSLLKLAGHLRARDEADAAVSLLLEARDVAEKLAEGGRPSELHLLASILNNLGNRLRQQGRFDEAGEQFRSCVVVRRRLAATGLPLQTLQLAASLLNAAALEDDRGDPDTALQLAREALASAEGSGQPDQMEKSLIARCAALVALFAAATGDLDLAESSASHAFDLLGDADPADPLGQKNWSAAAECLNVLFTGETDHGLS